MKILFISHRIPYPPNKGDKLRAFNILKHLSQKHELDLACLLDSPHEQSYATDLEPYCNQIFCEHISPLMTKLNYLRYLFSKYPLTLAHFYSAGFRQKLTHWLKREKYDLIYVYSAAMSQYVLDVDHIPKLLDLVDADCRKWLDYAEYARFPLSYIYRLEGKRTQEYEKRVCPGFAACTVVSEAEKHILEQFITTKNLYAVANGINQARYKSYQTTEKPTLPSLLFVGGMFYFAYIDGILHFYNQAFDKIRAVFPKLKFYIVGADPAPEVLKLNRDPNVRVTGYVEDVVTYLKQATVYVVPLRMAPGLQNKILEAMAMGIPVVSTSAAIQGIDAQPGRDVLVADDPGAFAEEVIKLLKNPALRQELAQNAKKLIDQKYDWQKNLKALDQIIEDIF